MRRSRQRIAKRKTNGSGHSGVMKTYGAYVFKTKDPVIDQLRSLVEEHYGKRVNDRGILTDIEHEGGPSVTCMRAWFFGETRRPQNPTIEAAGRAMGYERRWHKMPKEPKEK